MDKFAILINTCDMFEDCWEPFFKLFSIYWPEYKGVMYLNTETKQYNYPGLNIVPLKVSCGINKPRKRLTWSECLKLALKEINEDIILYMQEDYFLKDSAKSKVVGDYVKLMIDNKDIHCVHLTDQAVKAKNVACKYSKYNLKLVEINQRYRISCQAALWRKGVLLSYLRPYESAWQFEEFGSQRASILQHNFFVVDTNWVKLNQFEIVPYIFTGIIRGRWSEQVIPLFDKHHIYIDYTKRGFVKGAPVRTLKVKIKNKWNKIPGLFKNYFDLRRLRRTTKCH